MYNSVNTGSGYIKILFTGFANDLGTGFTEAQTIGCSITGLSNYSTVSPISCILTPDPTTPFITVSSFSSITAGTSFTLLFVIMNPSTSGSITVQTGFISYNSINTITDSKTFSVSLASSVTNWPTNTGTLPSFSVVGSLTTFVFNLKPTLSSNLNDMLVIIFPSG